MGLRERRVEYQGRTPEEKSLRWCRCGRMEYAALKERRVPVHTHRLEKALQAVDPLGNR